MQPKLDVGRGLGTSIMQKETRSLDVKAGGRVRYRIWKYVIVLGPTAHDLAFTSEGACVVKKLVSNERSSMLEIATFRPKSYCKSLIKMSVKYVRLLGAYINLQLAV